MNHETHHPSADRDEEPDHDKTTQPMHEDGDTGFGGSDHTTTAKPMHHGGGSGPPHAGTGSHVHNLEDFRKRFIISTILTIPILLLSPVIQSFFGFRFDFPGSLYVTLPSCLHCLFLWGIPVPERDRPGAAGTRAGHDDPDRGRDQRRVFLQRRRCVRPAWVRASSGNWQRSSTSCFSATGSR